MYQPSAFREDRIEVLHAAIGQARLATLITLTQDGLIASHVPMLLDPEPGPYGTLLGHLARPNPQGRGAVAGLDALAIFQGPDAYITPSWYETKRQTGKVVPTWNYVAVHAYGPVTFFDDTERLREIVTRLTERQEIAAFATLGGHRRPGRLHRWHAQGHHRLHDPHHPARGQMENEPEPASPGYSRRDRGPQRGRGNRDRR